MPVSEYCVDSSFSVTYIWEMKFLVLYFVGIRFSQRVAVKSIIFTPSPVLFHECHAIVWR